MLPPGPPCSGSPAPAVATKRGDLGGGGLGGGELTGRLQAIRVMGAAGVHVEYVQAPWNAWPDVKLGGASHAFGLHHAAVGTLW